MKLMMPKRRLVPRWRTAYHSLLTSEGTEDKRTKARPARVEDESIVQEGFALAVARWRESPTEGYLGEVLSYAVRPELKEAVQAISTTVLSSGLDCGPLQSSVMRDLLAEREEQSALPAPTEKQYCQYTADSVSRLRSLLRLNPRNPLALLDYAQLQLASGKRRSAHRALLTAASLSPNSRLSLRTLARYYLHIGEPGKAHDLVRKHPRAQRDPWLAASEIALADAADVPSQLAAKGKRWLKEGMVAKSDQTELAAAIGMSELANGKLKYARDLFRIALLHPNDNVVAQAVYANSDLGILVSENLTNSRHESDTLLSWNAGEIAASHQSAIQWYREEPFSSRPLQYLGCYYVMEREYETARNVSIRGLLSNPDDVGLLNNLAFSLAYLGEHDEAAALVAKALRITSTTWSPYLIATLGLVHMLTGLFSEADTLYVKAIELFEKKKQLKSVTSCWAYYARAAADSGHPDAEKIREHALLAHGRAPTTDSGLLLGLESGPEKFDPTRRLSQWVFDPLENSISQRVGVTKRGAPAFVVADKRDQFKRS